MYTANNRILKEDKDERKENECSEREEKGNRQKLKGRKRRMDRNDNMKEKINKT